MKNSFGQSLILTLYGESHGPAIGAVLDGLPPGLIVSAATIDEKLSQRRPHGGTATARVEPDHWTIDSGVLPVATGTWRTTGTPVALRIENVEQQSEEYRPLARLIRPGHADYTAEAKYHGFQDTRGSGHFSGRLTAAIVAAGAILQDALREKGICIATQLLELGPHKAASFSTMDPRALQQAMDRLNTKIFPVVNTPLAERMKATIMAHKKDGDSIGGRLETIITGIEAGVGEPFFDNVESVLAHAIFAIPGVKGMRFGDLDAALSRGSSMNDIPFPDADGIRFRTNHSGGINGGITNAMPILFQTALRPPASIAKAQETLDLDSGESKKISIKGRHDPAIAPRARAVVDAMSALALADLLLQRHGTDWLRPRQ